MSKKILFFLVASSFSGFAFGQRNDLALLKKNIEVKNQHAEEKHTRASFYWNAVHPQLGVMCLYDMPCRDFYREAFREFGIIKGSFLSIDRMGRCSRLSVIETLPARLTSTGKVKERPADYRLKSRE